MTVTVYDSYETGRNFYAGEDGKGILKNKSALTEQLKDYLDRSIYSRDNATRFYAIDNGNGNTQLCFTDEYFLHSHNLESMRKKAETMASYPALQYAQFHLMPVKQDKNIDEFLMYIVMPADLDITELDRALNRFYQFKTGVLTHPYEKEKDMRNEFVIEIIESKKHQIALKADHFEQAKEIARQLYKDGYLSILPSVGTEISFHNAGFLKEYENKTDITVFELQDKIDEYKQKEHPEKSLDNKTFIAIGKPDSPDLRPAVWPVFAPSLEAAWKESSKPAGCNEILDILKSEKHSITAELLYSYWQEYNPDLSKTPSFNHIVQLNRDIAAFQQTIATPKSNSIDIVR